MKCSSCGFENPDLAKFCNHCGAKIEQHGKTCPNPECKRSGLPEEAVFCPDCGTAITQTNNSETISSILSGLENNRKVQTQQGISPVKEISNTVERNSNVKTENNTGSAQSSPGSTILDALEGIGNFFASVVGFILGAIPVVLLIFVLFRGCS